MSQPRAVTSRMVLRVQMVHIRCWSESPYSHEHSPAELKMALQHNLQAAYAGLLQADHHVTTTFAVRTA